MYMRVSECDMKKTFVLDTNVLLSDSQSIFSFNDNDVIIPMAVLEELDRQKNRQDDVGKNARNVNRLLDDLRRDVGSLVNGVRLRGGGTLRVLSASQTDLKYLPIEFGENKVDNFIIATVIGLLKKEPNTILVSKDINVRIKCDSLNIKCQDYLHMRAVPEPEKFYRGVSLVNVDVSVVDEFYDKLSLQVNDGKLNNEELFANQIVVMKATQDGSTVKSAIGKYVEPEKRLVPVSKIEQAFGLKPRNKEQSFSFDLLFDTNINLLTLVGPAGTGKTCLTLAAALEQLRGIGSTPRYDKLIVSRPVQPVGKEIGFLPGTLAEKMEPWIAPIKDNMSFLLGSKRTDRGNNDRKRRFEDSYLSLMQEKGIIEIEAITFIRGRSIPNAIIVIDEAQNLTVHELKTIVTRVGEGTKIILTGDLDQIDNVHVDVYTNGLTYAIEKFKQYPMAGHVTLIKGERSALATLASKIL